MLNTAFPIYALREYKHIQEYDGYTVISSHLKDYILDDPRLEGDYAARRLQLSSMELPFKLYPLNQQYSTLSQLANSKKRMFIDSRGKLFKYTPTKFYTIEYTKVLRAEKTWNGWNRLMTKLPVSFVTEQVAPYIAYIKVGSAYYLYGLSNTKEKSHRKKL
jgi:hypothetical protein